MTLSKHATQQETHLAINTTTAFCWPGKPLFLAYFWYNNKKYSYKL